MVNCELSIGLNSAQSTVFIAPLLFAIACGTPEAIHPTSENIPIVSDEQFILRADEVTEITYGHKDQYDVIEIGHDPEAFFGHIWDLTTDYNGTIYVLDKEFSHVRAYDYGGSLIATIGKAGEGPGEFYNPQSVSVTDGGKTIVVASVSSSRINVFDRNDDDFNLRSSFRGAVGPWATCAMNGHVYVLGAIEGRTEIIHKYTYDGELVMSFGELYRSPVPRVVNSLSYRGWLACNQEEDIVGWIRRYVPVITGFSSTGEILWRVRVADFTPSRVEHGVNEEGLDSITFSPLREGESAFMHFFSGDEPAFYVLYGTAGSRVKMARIHAHTGHNTFLNSSTGLVPRLIVEDTLITFRNRPYPLLKIWRPQSLDG